MQKNTRSFLGIDVSKEWFDVCLMQLTEQVQQPVVAERFVNDPTGIKTFHKWLKTHKVSFDDKTLLVIENTGVYHRLIWQYCSDRNLPLHIGNAAHIKWSFGIVRSKNDRIDAERLCKYGFRHFDELKATPALDRELLRLKDLAHARKRLDKQITSMEVYLKELKRGNDAELDAIMEQAHGTALKGLQASLEMVDKKIMEIVSGNEGLSSNYELLLSVPGIGPVIAVYLLCCTVNFAAGRTGKQLASYAGVAPFEQSSGKSVKSRNKVHRMANKELKGLLFMGARSAAASNKEYKAYYERKTKEGKHYNSVINAISSKILLRAVAVIKKGEPYVDKYGKKGQETAKKDLLKP
jgi:transposase